MSTRRDFLKTTAAVGGALTLGLGSYACSPRRLNILILGGTNFTGPHLVRYGLERGHSISVFTRGLTQPTIHTDLYEQVEHLVGDRNDNHEALEGRTWDVVIDNSGRQVEWTTTSAELLRDAADLYMYTSSTGVYLPYLGMDITEDTELVLEDPPELPEERRPSYGVMKSLSEMEARRIFGEDRTIVVRPTYIVGPADPTNRWQYWPIRIRRGGEVFVPGKEDDPVQYIDVRDLTEFMIRLLENRTTGTFNVAGPASPQGMHAFVHGVHDAIGSDVEWIMGTDYDFLREHNVLFNIPWILPEDDYVGSARVNIERATAAGLTFRPLAQTTMDTLAWWDSDAVAEERRGMAFQGPRSFNPEREAEVIAAWKAREA
jgi:2'-hydroxyisoflavone reductase